MFWLVSNSAQTAEAVTRRLSPNKLRESQMSPYAQYLQYAEEAMLSARHSESAMERRGLLDLALTWTQAAAAVQPELAESSDVTKRLSV